MTAETKITAVANTVGTLMQFDSGRAGAMVQVPLSQPVWISRDPTCPMAPPSTRIPAQNARGDAGEYTFGGPAYELWYYQTAVSGDFTVVTW